MTAAPQPIQAPTPDQITKEILDAATAHAAATREFVSQFVFYGKTLQDWSDELAVPIAKNPTPQDMREIYVRLANNIQIASHFLSVASSINSTLLGGGKMKKADLVRAIVEQYEKNKGGRPAATVIDAMADSYMKQTVSSRVAAAIVKDFWRQRLDSLIEVRKICEQIGISMSTEMKYLSNHQGDSA